MARVYNSWNANRGNTNNRLDDIPFITNTIDGTTRYYSAVDAELFFGDIFIDEVTNISWAVQQQAMPLFGYNSFTFDDVAVGSRMVQGTFAVNFTKSNYLMSIQNDKEFNAISRRTYGVDNPHEGVFSSSNPKRRLGLPLWDHGFDIVIGFGEQKNSKSLVSNTYSTYVILDCCQLVSSQMSLDYNGEPVQEIYTFIARDIKYSSESNYSDDSTVITSSDTTTGGVKWSAVMYQSNGQIVLTPDIDVHLYSGTIALNDVFTDKTLCYAQSLRTGENGTVITEGLSADKLKSLKAEIKENELEQLTAKLNITYQLTNVEINDNNKKTYQINVPIKII